MTTEEEIQSLKNECEELRKSLSEFLDIYLEKKDYDDGMDNEFAKMFKMTSIRLQSLEEDVLNIGGNFIGLEKTMIDYMEKNPKHSDDWIEARLRKLEADTKFLIEEIRKLK